MDNIALADCSHRGQALWVSHWEAWCGECGVTLRFPEIINDRAHARGDVYETA